MFRLAMVFLDRSCGAVSRFIVRDGGQEYVESEADLPPGATLQPERRGDAYALPAAAIFDRFPVALLVPAGTPLPLDPPAFPDLPDLPAPPAHPPYLPPPASSPNTSASKRHNFAPVFQACSFNHSDISPCLSNQQFTG